MASERSRRRGMLAIRLMLGSLAAGCGPAPGEWSVGALPERVDYNFHVKPIISDRCLKCHGPDSGARKANLRLDTPDGPRTVLRGRYLRLFGASELAHRVTTDDSSEMMPPRESGLAL